MIDGLHKGTLIKHIKFIISYNIYVVSITHSSQQEPPPHRDVHWHSTAGAASDASQAPPVLQPAGMPARGDSRYLLVSRLAVDIAIRDAAGDVAEVDTRNMLADLEASSVEDTQLGGLASRVEWCSRDHLVFG